MIDYIVLGGGCFWCTQAVIERIEGVVHSLCGYSGGEKSWPSYEEVCGGTSGHAEVVAVWFDTEILALSDLLHLFFITHDPTSLNRQGADVGTQYRSYIGAQSEVQLAEVEKIVGEIQQVYSDPIVTQIELAKECFPAEEGHQHYFERNQSAGYCSVVITPKLGKLREAFADRFLPVRGIVRRELFPQSPEEWELYCSPERYRVLREKGTEPSFRNAYWNNHEEGDYFCAGCGQLLFHSEQKYDSGTGWPSFFQPADEDALRVAGDDSHGMVRDEIVCSHCASHLGHVFTDGPEPTGLRYCMNSLALEFSPSNSGA